MDFHYIKRFHAHPAYMYDIVHTRVVGQRWKKIRKTRISCALERLFLSYLLSHQRLFRKKKKIP